MPDDALENEMVMLNDPPALKGADAALELLTK